MSGTFFRITLMRSAIGLPSKSLNVLKALGLRKRMGTVFHPVTPAVAGQIMKVKELIAVSEVEEPMTRAEVHQARVPEKGFYVESKMVNGQRVKIVDEP
jgi:large subunit ribosomal protein L30